MLKELSHAHQGRMYLIKNTVKQLYCENIYSLSILPF